MKKYGIILLIIIMMLSNGCASRNDYILFKDIAKQCVDNEEVLLLELFSVYNNKTIIGISRIDNSDSTENGIVLDYNDCEYYIVSLEGKEASRNSEELLRACEIVDYLINEYSIIDFNYYSSPGYLQIKFDENYINVDWSIVYYPSNVAAPENIDDVEEYEAIKNGFYIYLLYPGF